MNKLYILIIGLLLITFFKVDAFTKSVPTSLFGVNIVIDPGHGGKERLLPGYSGTGGSSQCGAERL